MVTKDGHQQFLLSSDTHLVPPLKSGSGFCLSWIWTAWWRVLTNINVVEMSLWTSRPCPEEAWKVAFFAFLPSDCHAKHVQVILLERKATKRERPLRMRRYMGSGATWRRTQMPYLIVSSKAQTYVRGLLGPPRQAQPSTECKTTERHSRYCGKQKSYLINL